MKQYMKPFFILTFLLMLGTVLVISHYRENNTLLGVSVMNYEELTPVISGKKVTDTPSDLLLYQSQPLPYWQDTNTFLLPVLHSDEAFGSLTTSNYGKIYLFPDNESSGFTAYVVNDREYYETSVIFTSSIVLTFQTEAFENETAYGIMNLYTPLDSELGTYSFKKSDAKLSYELSDQLLPSFERNYELKLTQNSNGISTPHKMNLADLRKDDDWELDPLMEFSDQILEFYSLWNEFCKASGQERFTVSFETVDFYLDGQYMGPYLLRVPLDDKQLDYVDGLWVTETDLDTILYSSEIQGFLEDALSVSPLYLEYYYRVEISENVPVVYALPRKLKKGIEQP